MTRVGGGTVDAGVVFTKETLAAPGILNLTPGAVWRDHAIPDCGPGESPESGLGGRLRRLRRFPQRAGCPQEMGLHFRGLVTSCPSPGWFLIRTRRNPRRGLELTISPRQERVEGIFAFALGTCPASGRWPAVFSMPALLGEQLAFHAVGSSPCKQLRGDRPAPCAQITEPHREQGWLNAPRQTRRAASHPPGRTRAVEKNLCRADNHLKRTRAPWRERG